MVGLLRWSQLIMAVIGAISCVAWFYIERYRNRQLPFMLGAWCFCLIAFRFAVIFVPLPETPEEIQILNSLSNTLYLLGAVIVSYTAISQVIGVFKHGSIH